MEATNWAIAHYWNALLIRLPYQAPRFELGLQVTFSAHPSLLTIYHHAPNRVVSYLTSASPPRLEAPRGRDQAGLVHHYLPSIRHLVATCAIQWVES